MFSSPTPCIKGKKSDAAQNNPKILIIYTGGTIGMRENPVTRALEPFQFEHLLENVPKLRLLDIEIESLEFPTPIDSSSMTPVHWQEIAGIVERYYNDFDGFVVLHGTDTMAYTASALSFMLRNLQKPVIITGSQLPIGDVRTDGEENLITSLQVASLRDPDGRQTVREVAILFNNQLLRGNRATKHSSDNFNAFTSNNYPALASIGLGIHVNRDALLRQEEAPLQVSLGMDADVMVVDLFPGITESCVRHIFNTPNIKGMVLKTFGSGNGPDDSWFIEALKDLTSRGVVVVNISQCSNGSVNPERYRSGLCMCNAGTISGLDLTVEAAITKLMYLFGKGYAPEKVKELIKTPLSGELTL